jgi:integrase
LFKQNPSPGGDIYPDTGGYGRPKTGKTRLVDLPGFLVEELVEYCRLVKKQNFQRGAGGRVDYLFIDPQEHYRWPYSQRKIQTLMKRVCKAAGLRQRNPHDLRHTYATMLLMAHQSPGYVQRQLGHSSISITMDVYCHWVPGEGRGGLEQALGGGEADTVRVPNSGEILPISTYNDKRLQ